MGMFNTIFTNLRCPVKRKLAVDAWIQIKIQEYESLHFDIYHAGDSLPGLRPECDNSWVRAKYICPLCSKLLKGGVRASDLKRREIGVHFVFLRIEKSVLCAVLTAAEFRETGWRGFSVPLRTGRGAAFRSAWRLHE